MSNATAEPSTDIQPDSSMPGRLRALAALTDLLETGDEADRCHACRALGVIGAAESVPALVRRLKDEDVDVCVDAAEALGRLGHSAAVPSLLDSLENDPDGEVKTAVVAALGRLGGSECNEALLRLVAHRPEHMVVDESDTWDAWWDIQLEAVEALGRMGVAQAAPVLDGILDQEEGQDIDSAVLKSLALLGAVGEERLARRLTHGEALGRRRAAAALGHARTSSAARQLARTLLDAVPEMRATAVEALGQAGAVQYLPAIALLHRDPDAEVRAAAIRVAANLAAGADEDALPVAELGDLIGDPAPEVRCVALAALARASALPDELREAVRTRLRDRDDASAMAACQVLARFADAASCGPLLQLLADSRREPRVRGVAARAAGASGVCSREVLTALTRAVGDADQAVRLAALSALADLGRVWPVEDAGGPRSERGELRTPHDVVTAALSGTLFPPEEPAEPPSADGTQPGDQAGGGPDEASLSARGRGRAASTAAAVRRAPSSTLEAIAQHNAEAGLGLHERRVAEGSDEPDDPPAPPEEHLGEYLDIVESNERTAEWLFARGTGPLHTDVRRLAARVLGGARFAGALPALVDALGDEDVALRTEAAASLALIAAHADDLPALDSALEPLLAACEDDDRDLRAAAARALGVLGDSAAAPTLASLLGDPDPAVRSQAVQALGRLVPDSDDAAAPLAARETMETLSPMLDDPVAGVRRAAISTLAALASAGRTPEHARTLERLLDASFAGDGSQARDAARALRRVDRDRTASRALARLGAMASSAERRVLIEVLEELYRA